MKTKQSLISRIVNRKVKRIQSADCGIMLCQNQCSGICGVGSR